ncbi:hypothetical protein Pelo_15401 [Pelomyxa schiedti]|nr:hypothetical protein Pelo_15401 [Pelomyxa schiedti]
MSLARLAGSLKKLLSSPTTATATEPNTTETTQHRSELSPTPGILQKTKQPVTSRKNWVGVCVCVLVGCTRETAMFGPGKCMWALVPVFIVKEILLLIKPNQEKFWPNTGFKLSDAKKSATKLGPSYGYGWILSGQFDLPDGSGLDLSAPSSSLGCATNWDIIPPDKIRPRNPDNQTLGPEMVSRRCYKTMWRGTGGAPMGLLGCNKVFPNTFSFCGSFEDRPEGCLYWVVVNTYTGGWGARRDPLVVVPAHCKRPTQQLGAEFTVEVDLEAGTVEIFLDGISLGQPLTLPRVSPKGEKIYWYHACSIWGASETIKLVTHPHYWSAIRWLS